MGSMKTQDYAISEMLAEDIDDATRMRYQSWLDTYVNDELGITKQFIDDRFAEQLAPGGIEKRRQRFLDGKAANTFNAWVARDENGTIIAAATPFISPEGIQRVGSIYVNKAYHGTGLANQLMERIVAWFDPSKPIQLEVITYNHRAQAFYKKWGFVAVEGSEQLYAEKMPEITMIRPPQNELTEGDK